MAAANNSDGLDHAILKLSPAEKAAYSHLFSLADDSSIGVVTGERAVSFFEKTHVPAPVLAEIWQIADTENRGLLTKPGFCMVLRLIGWWQCGQAPATDNAFKTPPALPKFDGITLPSAPQHALPSPRSSAFGADALQPQLSGQSAGGAPIRVPSLVPEKVQQYSMLFERSGAQNGILDGGTAKSIFEKAGLPNEVLGKIWMLSDREQRGGLDQTEFIVAMHLLTSMKSRAMTSLPTNMPQGLWEAAARRGQRPPSRQTSVAGAIPRQFSGPQTQARTQSPLARTAGFSTPPTQHAQLAGAGWLITQQEKGQYDQLFAGVDTGKKGLISGEQAVNFFSSSGLSEDTLAQIWDLADIDSDGDLNSDEFAVAMYLIKQQRSPNSQPLPAFLPTALIPPSMRGPQLQQASQQATPVPQPKPSAAMDLFGLDDAPQSSQSAVLQPQLTGASATRDPFAGSQPGSPSTAAPFQQQQSTGGVFKQFVPTSAFGSRLAQQNTGTSSTSSQPQQAVPMQQQQRGFAAPASSNMDDLLGDSEATAEESRNLTNDSTELANMSNQIGNLRNQMEATQSKKQVSQAGLASTATQKRDLEQRLQQFRAQYESEVRAVKELDTQLAASRADTKKLSQELAMLEGSHQDLSTQRSTISQQLQADQQENANLKQRISQLNAEVAQLKPEIEKMKLDARQQKGLVSINKKQLSTNESERDRLTGEKADLEREAATFAGQETASRGMSPEPAMMASQASNVASPSAASAVASTNPFFRKAETSMSSPATSPPATATSGPTPSAFDALFGPSSAFAPGGQVGSRSGTPPATSFVGRSLPAAAAATGFGAAATGVSMTDSVSSVGGEATPAGTPPQTADTRNTETSFLGTPAPDSGDLSREIISPPPPPESRQFTPTNLPLGGPFSPPEEDARSTAVIPPASRAGDEATPTEDIASPLSPPEREVIPGAFPSDEAQPSMLAKELPDSNAPSTQGVSPAAAVVQGGSNVNDDFDAAFAGFENGQASKDVSTDQDPFAPAEEATADTGAARSVKDEFPPIQSLEHDDEDDSSSDEDDDDVPGSKGFEDEFAPSSSQPRQAIVESPVPDTLAAPADEPPITTPGDELPDISKQASPPTYDQSNLPSHGGNGDRTSSNQFPPEFGGLLPSREDPTNSPPPATSPPVEASTTAAEIPAEESQSAFLPPERASSLQPESSTAQTLTTPTTDVFVDASSRPMSSITDAEQAPGAVAGTQKSDFDDFDEFDDFSEAKEADKPADPNFDFGFGGQNADDFNPAFDSPTASNTATPTPATRSVQQSQDSTSSGNAFADFTPNVSSSPFGNSATDNGSIQETPQSAQHDWDAIFSGLDSSKDVDISFPSNNTDPWATTNGAASSSAAVVPTMGNTLAPTTTNETIYQPPPGPPPSKMGIDRGGALTPGTEHDDPILKRLTGMGYARTDALNALEMYDYDIGKAVDHLSGA